ncbi:Predicted nucleotide-binding protein containing TIR-like domain-containing protein [Chitinophaga sp. YR627]|uniref:nucleotide-binding protein n=1 Tax=Chitinophaga sp. YR627 TaxID=1881041 RepID=UPI0008EC646D|nr:nucleotide-binding protein [Chitinophaga sp. YR627]SFN21330.1 Predicted nucleotide-binding protein containing TIR-like domain-containing protein [Chitinophaga sp. YR627]
MKPKIFIGSSSEALDLAEAIQSNLEHSAYCTIWNQGIFSLSSNALDDLLKTLDVYDYGIFIFRPDDKSTIRKEEYSTIRDNVIFELGLYFGKLGKTNAFYLIPRNYPKLHLPSDLGGITAGTYDHERLITDRNFKATVGPFCTQIKEMLNKGELTKTNIGVSKAAFFNNFTTDFESLIRAADNITLFFIHSRQWRENNQNAIDGFLKRKNTKLNVYLPNFTNTSLLERIKSNFSDAVVIESLIKDAFRFFLELKSEFKGKVEIRYFNFYPTYSFYHFDNEAVVAMYPTTPKKKNVPSFLVSKNSAFWNFIEDDLRELRKHAKKIDKFIIDKL